MAINLESSMDIRTAYLAEETTASVASQFTSLRSITESSGTNTEGARADRISTVGMLTGDLYRETDTGWVYRYDGLSWTFFTGVGAGSDATRLAITPIGADDDGAKFYVRDTDTWYEVTSGAWAAMPVAVTAPALAVATKTANYTLTDADDVILVDATAGAVTIALHAVGTAKKKVYYFKKIDASVNAMTLDPNGAETVDSAATLATTTQWVSFSLFPTSGGWMIL